jgi:nicotinamide mononucleotide transporter
MTELLLNLKKNVDSTTTLEWIAVVTALLQVLLAVLNRKLNFLFGAISVGIYIYLFSTGGLYADAALNLYYLAVSIYGYWAWSATAGAIGHVSWCARSEFITAIAICIGSFLISYLTLTTFTNSTVAIQDSAVAAFAWAGTWLLSKRKIENWLWLNVSNAVAIPLLYHKGFAVSAVLTCILFIIAIFGFVSWQNRFRKQQS